MAKPNGLPQIALEQIKTAAEYLVKAEMVLCPLNETRPMIREEIETRAAKGRLYISQALRCLEAAGAQTRPTL